MATSSTKTRHYAARPDVDHADIAAGGAGPVWRDTLEGRYLTDPDAVAAALPAPLEPTGDPTVRVAIATGTNPDGSSFGEGRVTVQARHGSIVGEYPLVVVVDTEHALLEARERFGDPARPGPCGRGRPSDSSPSSLARGHFHRQRWYRALTSGGSGRCRTWSTAYARWGVVAVDHP